MIVAALRRQLETWAFREAPPHLLAIFRVAFGGFLLLYWGLKAPHVPMLYSVRGLLLPTMGAHPASLLHWLFSPTPLLAWCIYTVMLICLLCVTLGIVFRPAAAAAVVLYFYYWQLSLHLFPTSFDRLFAFVLVVLACSRADAALSLRAVRTRGVLFPDVRISVLPQRILALQIAITYLGVGWQKMVLPDWIGGGEVLPYSFVGLWGTALGFWIVRQNWPMEVYDAVVMLVMAFEFFLPFGLWVPRWQWGFFAGGALFHVGIALTLGIWWFLVLLPAYIVFLSPEAVAAVVDRWMGRTAAHRRRLPAVAARSLRR